MGAEEGSEAKPAAAETSQALWTETTAEEQHLLRMKKHTHTQQSHKEKNTLCKAESENPVCSGGLGLSKPLQSFPPLL